jgi:hypothetical protein
MTNPYTYHCFQKSPFNFRWLWLILAIVVAILCCINWTFAQEEVNLDIIAQIESSNNPLAYNAKSGASGMFQLMPCVVEEYNAWHPASKIAFKAVFSPVVARSVAKWYLDTRIPQMLRFYGISDTLENRLWAYNAGIGRVVKGIMPQETKNYIAKYHKLADK